MKHSHPGACLSIPLLKYVRDAKPSEAQLLAWLGANAGRYHVLRKAGLLVVADDRVCLSPQHCSADQRTFRHEDHIFVLDEDIIRIIRRSR